MKLMNVSENDQKLRSDCKVEKCLGLSDWVRAIMKP